jgi:Leucine-rich repeat (LRR) protein
LRNVLNVKDDAYETLIFAYSRELDLFVLTSSITISNVEKESSPPYLEDTVTDSKEETTNLEDTTLMVTPQSTMGSNEPNDPPMAPSSTHYFRNRV